MAAACLAGMGAKQTYIAARPELAERGMAASSLQHGKADCRLFGRTSASDAAFSHLQAGILIIVVGVSNVSCRGKCDQRDPGVYTALFWKSCRIHDNRST